MCVAAEDRCSEVLPTSPPRVGSGWRSRSFLGVEPPKKLFVWNSNPDRMLLSAGGNVSCGFDSIPPEFPGSAGSTVLVREEGPRGGSAHVLTLVGVLSRVPRSLPRDPREVAVVGLHHPLSSENWPQIQVSFLARSCQ
jgi:hypothetical protein